MRIALVCPRYLPFLGGVENHVAQLATHLSGMGHQVTVATQTAGRNDLAAVETLEGVVIRRFGSGIPLLGHGMSPGLWRWLRGGADGADVVHVHNAHALTSLACLAAAHRPVLFTPHYLGRGEGMLLRWSHAVFDLALRLAVLRTAKILCTTDWEQREFTHDVGSAARSAVVPNGVAVATDVAIPDPARAMAARGPLIVVAGRLEGYKQHDRVLAALPHLPAHQLVVLGDGPRAEDLTELARDLDVTDRVLFAGRVPPHEVAGWFATADVVASLSRRECFGMTLAEGLVAGARVVASDIGPHRDVLALGGSRAHALVPVDASARVVADAIRGLGRRGATAVPTFPAWSDVARSVEHHYDQAIIHAK